MDPRAQKIVKAYAVGVDGLTDGECLDAEFTQDQCDVLRYSLAWRPWLADTGVIEFGERDQLKNAGFTDEFIKDLAGDDGFYALKKRVEWLVPNIRKKMWPFGFSDTERGAMILELSKAGPLAKEAVPNIIDALLDKSFNYRNDAARALGAIGDERAISALAQILRSEEPDNGGYVGIEETAAEALGKIGIPAVPTLIDLLGEKVHLRDKIAVQLGIIGDRRAVPALMEALGDWNGFVRQYSAEALGKIGDRSAVPALIKALRLTDDDIYRLFKEQNGFIGDLEVTHLKLAETLRKVNNRVHYSIITSLGDLKDRRALPVLLEELEKDTGNHVYHIAEAITKAGPPDMLWLMTALENTDNDNFCWAATAILMDLGPEFSFMALPILEDVADGRGHPDCQSMAKKAFDVILDKTP